MTRTPTDLCPKCGYLLECATALEPDTKPKCGDFSLCISCGAVLQFDGELRVHGFDGHEWRMQLALQPEAIATIVRAQRIIWKRGPLPPKAKAES